MVCCVNSPTEFTEFTEVCGCCWLRGYGRMPYPPNLCASVRICGRFFSARRFCAHPCQSVGGTSQPEGSVLSVRSVGGASLPEGSVCSVHSVGFIPACFVGAVLALTVGKVELRLLDSGGSVGMAGCHTLLICAHPCASVGGTSLPEGSVCSVRSVGGVSQPEECVLWEVLLNQKSE